MTALFQTEPLPGVGFALAVWVLPRVLRFPAIALTQARSMP